MQDKLSHRAEPAPTPPSENSFNGSSAFTDFIREHNRPLRRGSLDELTQQVEKNQPPHPSQHFMPPKYHGLKISKPRDLDWSVFAKFTGKGTYPGVGADFKVWRMRFLQRLGAAQLISEGD